MEEIIPGKNGLPPMKDDYTPEEKALIVVTAAKVGVHKVAEAYQMSWHRITSWKWHYANQVNF